MATYYHVTRKWDGSDLESLAHRLGDESKAVNKYSRRWPDAGDLAPYHVHMIHLFGNLDDARDNTDILGKTILEISDPDDCLDIRTDTLEFAHPVAMHVIPKEYIRKIK